MDNGIRILTEDEFNNINIKKCVYMSDVGHFFQGMGSVSNYEPYLVETGSVPKIVQQDGTIREFNNIKMGRKFGVNLQGKAVAVPNYNFQLLKKYGIRPVIPLSMIPESIASNTTNYFSYGYYPINILGQLEQNVITNMFLKDTYNKWGSITINGKQYHVIEIFTNEFGYRRIINLLEHHDKFKKDEFFEFTTRDNVDYMWSRLEQIEWTIDRKLGLAIADYLPMAGISFNDTIYYKSFKDTKLYKWLNTEFVNTLMMFEDEKLIIPKKNNKKKEQETIADFKNTKEYKKIINSVRFLSYDECFGDKKLDLFKHISHTATFATDFALLTGAPFPVNNIYWTQTKVNENVVFFSDKSCNIANIRDVCIRPVIPYSLISKFIDKNNIKEKDGYIEFDFGAYPQKAASDDLQYELDDYKNTLSMDFEETDSTYTIDEIEIYEIDEPISEWEIREYTYKLKKYVQVTSNLSRERCLLSNREEYVNCEDVWVEVLPVTWIASLKDDIAMTKNLLLAGIQFDYDKKSDFDESSIKDYLQKYFLPNIFQNTKIKISKEEIVSNNLFALDLSNFSFTDIDTQKNNRKKELGIDDESIKEFKKKIKNVSNAQAEKLGNELFNKLINEAQDENYEEFLKLIMSGANVNYKDTENNLNFPLIICARNNYLKTFITLIKAGADINMVTDYGVSNAMLAARFGNKEILEILILMGVDINIKSFNGDTALSIAELYKQKECFDMLVEAGAYLNNTNLKVQTTFEHNKQKEENFGVDDLFLEASKLLQDISGNQKIKKK